MTNAILIIFAIAFLVVVGTVAFGTWRWNVGTAELHERLERVRIEISPATVDFAEFESLPLPVARYLRTVLQDGQGVVAGVHLRHVGTFNMSETAEQWKSFTSEQTVITRRPAFDWNGRIALFPGVPVLVHDAYVAGEGILHASLLGLVSLAKLEGAGALAEGELLRFFAEAAWYPTALLPSQGVQWEALDDNSATGTITDGGIRATMVFAFDEQGYLESVSATRGRTTGGEIVATPWRGRFWNYQARAGMQVPLDGEVAWLVPQGERPYWRGSIADVEYVFATDEDALPRRSR